MLRKICEKTESRFGEINAACSVLLEFGIRPRYDRGLDVTEADMRTALNYAKNIRDFVKAVSPGLFDDE
jgi:hypothetical protein